MSSKLWGSIKIFIVHLLISLVFLLIAGFIFAAMGVMLPKALGFPLGMAAGLGAWNVYTRQKLEQLFKPNDPPSK